MLLLEGVNGLGTLALVALEALENGGSMDQALPAVDTYIDGVTTAQDLIALPAPEPDTEPCVDAVYAIADGGAAAAEDADGRVSQDKSEATELKNALRAARRWGNTRPFGLDIIIRQCLELFSRGMRLMLYWSSDRCERDAKHNTKRV